MANQALLESIKEKSNKFTGSEKKIADYILVHYNEVMDCTITELAERVNTSDASIVRFCKVFGCKGYKSFKIRLARDVMPGYKQLNIELEENDTAKAICQKIFNMEIAALYETLEILNVDKLEQLAKRINKAGKVEVFGAGGSSIVAQDIMHKFTRVGIECIFVSDVDIQAITASFLKKGDVVIGISHTGSTKSTLNCLSIAKKNGAFVALLTTQAKSPMARCADLVIPVSSKETLLKSESTSARITDLVVMDAVLAIVVAEDYKKYSLGIGKARNATSDNKF